MKNLLPLSACLIALTLAACDKPAPSPMPYGGLAGTITHISEKKGGFTINTEHGFIFVTLAASDRELLQKLKTGEKVTLLGEQHGDGGKYAPENEFEIRELVFEDGRRIPL